MFPWSYTDKWCHSGITNYTKELFAEKSCLNVVQFVWTNMTEKEPKIQRTENNGYSPKMLASLISVQVYTAFYSLYAQ